MRTIEQLLKNKSRSIISVSPDATVYDALEVMAEKDIGALLVMETGKLMGIFSERDYARKLVLHGRSSKETLVCEVMTERVIHVKTNQSVEECMALMTDKRVRHLPVMRGNEVIGVLSIGDLVKETISEKEFMIKQLETYIMT